MCTVCLKHVRLKCLCLKMRYALTKTACCERAPLNQPPLLGCLISIRTQEVRVVRPPISLVTGFVNVGKNASMTCCDRAQLARCLQLNGKPFVWHLLPTNLTYPGLLAAQQEQQSLAALECLGSLAACPSFHQLPAAAPQLAAWRLGSMRPMDCWRCSPCCCWGGGGGDALPFCCGWGACWYATWGRG